MESVNVAFSTTSGFFSRVIRWFTRSKVSHSLITFKDETLDKVFVMEANGRGFMLRPWARWRKSNQLVARYTIAVPQHLQIDSLRKLADSLGAEYDYVSLFGFIWRRFVSRTRNPLSSSSKLICSEVVAQFLDGIDYEGLGFEDPSSWTPEDLYAEIEKRDVFVLEEPKRDDRSQDTEHQQL